MVCFTWRFASYLLWGTWVEMQAIDWSDEDECRTSYEVRELKWPFFEIIFQYADVVPLMRYVSWNEVNKADEVISEGRIL